ncbi:MAG: hypothetical protein MK106_16190 [Mariniblastus sp.]|nr:hypothetical protein [Mariniblastus sp.]
MSSDKQAPPHKSKHSQDLEEVLGAIKRDAKSVPLSDDLDALKERLDRVEYLVEEVGRARQLQIALQDYINDLTVETEEIRKYRFWITAFAWLAAVGMLALDFFMIVSEPEWFRNLDGKLQVPLMISFVTGSVVLWVILIKGVYRSRNERHSGEVIPEPVRLALETYNSSQG